MKSLQKNNTLGLSIPNFEMYELYPAKTITGKIIDIATNQPIEGVNIYSATNPEIGTATDQNGNYTLTVSGNADLVFSHLTYENETINVNQVPSVMYLAPKTESLDEVVITAPKKTNWLMYAGIGLIGLAIIYNMSKSNKKPSSKEKLSGSTQRKTIKATI